MDLASEVGMDYSYLQELLAQGSWKKADEETLVIMRGVMGRGNQELRDIDIQRFPCSDLRTIDQLWKHYSKGQFGFSVQVRVYERDVEENFFGVKTFDRVAKKLGWTMDYNGLTFVPSAPKGHLPAKIYFRFGLFGKMTGDIPWKHILFKEIQSRLSNCGI